MALTANKLVKQVDLPVWEWLKPSPSASSTTGLSTSCVGDPAFIDDDGGRYIYYILNTNSFWRYDTVTDTYLQLSNPPFTASTSTAMRYFGAQGYYNIVISATSNTISTGMPYGSAAIGKRIRIVSGKGAGQERVITNVSDPIVVESGSMSGTGTTTATDSSKSWAFNRFKGHMFRESQRISGPTVTRKILKNSGTVLTFGETNSYVLDPFCVSASVSLSSGSPYQIDYSTITVDTSWDVTPDDSSRFCILSGGIWYLAGHANAPAYALAYYDILHDLWYIRQTTTNIFNGGQSATVSTPAEITFDRIAENDTLWYIGNCASSSNTTTLVDSSANWTAGEWTNHEVYIYTGTGRGQIATITNNTSNSLSFSALSTAPDATSKYQILGYDGGKSSGSNEYNKIKDSTKSWTVNRWANYGVRILSGTGAGQLRQIRSNTSTEITIYGYWNIQPDSTSVYVIQGSADVMYLASNVSAAVYPFYSCNGLIDITTPYRIHDHGVVSVACALLSDADHNIFEANPIAISGISGTTTITATTVQNHNLEVGQYVSIRGITSAAADQYNVTGLVQVASVPSATTFTYTPFSAGTGTYSYLTAASATNIPDASKDYRNLVSSANTTSITFSRVTPSNINGWYVSGTNIVPGTRVSGGAGTATVTLSVTASGTPTGVIIFSPIGFSTTSTYSSGGGAGLATMTLTGNTLSTINGWFVSGTNILPGTYVTSGAGTASIVLSKPLAGTPSGTITFTPPDYAGKIVSFVSGNVSTTNGGTQTGHNFINGIGPSALFVPAATSLTPTAGYKYAVCEIGMIGAQYDQPDATGMPNYIAGIATGGSTSSIVDAATFWTSATGTGTSGQTTITLSIVSPGGINGWFISGTGIAPGAQIVSGAGTNTLTVNLPHTGSVSGTMTVTAWTITTLNNRRVRILTGSSGVLNQELPLSSVTPTTGTISYGIQNAPETNASVYILIAAPQIGSGTQINHAYNNGSITSSDIGRFIYMARGGANLSWIRFNVNNDRFSLFHPTPFTETLTTGSFYAYDGKDRIYFSKENTLRVYYLDLSTYRIHGAGLMPYIAGSNGVGNKMEIFTTADRLKFLWVNRSGNVEHYRTLLFY